MTWLMLCDTCHTPIRGDHETEWTATGKEIHHHPTCKNERPFVFDPQASDTASTHTDEG